MIPSEARTVLVTPQDVARCGYCMSRVRPWCDQHGIDFREFVRHGVDGETLLSTNDQCAIDAVEEALRRVSNGR